MFFTSMHVEKEGAMCKKLIFISFIFNMRCALVPIHILLVPTCALIILKYVYVKRVSLVQFLIYSYMDNLIYEKNIQINNSMQEEGDTHVNKKIIQMKFQDKVEELLQSSEKKLLRVLVTDRVAMRFILSSLSLHYIFSLKITQYSRDATISYLSYSYLFQILRMS